MVTDKKETWKDVMSYDGLYEISSLGRIKSCPHKRIGWNYKSKSNTIRKYKAKFLKNTKSKSARYVAVILCKNGTKTTYLLHRLVATHFINNPNDLPIVGHIDNNTDNNQVTNLTWCTQLENVHHCIKSGRNNNVSGEDNGLSKLTNSQALEIIQIAKRGHTNKAIAELYGINESTVSRIKNRLTYKSITL